MFVTHFQFVRFDHAISSGVTDARDGDVGDDDGRLMKNHSRRRQVGPPVYSTLVPTPMILPRLSTGTHHEGAERLTPKLIHNM